MSNTKAGQSRAKAERKQKTFNRIVLVSILIIVAVLTAYAFTRQTTVPLPAYLDRCIAQNTPLFYQASFQLLINVSGVLRTIPAGIGVEGSCVRPLSTVTPTGIIHVAADENVNYTLGDFFLVWGNTYGPGFEIFNQSQLFGLKTINGHALVMVVNGARNYSFQNFIVPRNASSNPGSSSLVVVAIYYT